MENNVKLPNFVRLGDVVLRLLNDKYYRDAGDWSIGCKIINNGLFSSCEDWFDKDFHNKPLIEATIDEWRKSNHGYLPQ